MRSFIYKTIDSSSKRGYNMTITVYEIKNNIPVFIGDDEKISTASYKGEKAVACQIISSNTDLEMDSSGYRLKDESVVVTGI